MSYEDVEFLGIKAYSDHPEVYALAETLTAAYFSKKLRKKKPKSMSRSARKLVASMVLIESDVFRFTTKTSYFSVSRRKQVWMTNSVLKLFKTAISLGWVTLVKKGIPPPASKIKEGGLAAIYCRSSVFKELIDKVDISDIVPDPDSLRVELKSEDDFQVELSEAVINHPNHLRTTNALVDHFNLLVASDVRYANGRPVETPNLFFVRKYKVNFSSSGRIYADIQNKPKVERLALTIAGSKVGSLDISQLHPMLILRLLHGTDYEMLGLFTRGLYEAYVMPDYKDLPRGVHKKLINALFNASSEESAVRALMSTHWWYDDITGKLKVVIYKGKKRRKGQCIFLESPKKSAIHYIESFKRHHPMYVEAIGRGLGVTLQAIDGTLIERIIEVANEAKVPLIPVHDEFIVREKDRVFIQVVLERVFRDWIGEKGQFGSIGAKWTSADGVEEPVLIDLSIKS
jgi:hypothetical protein